MCSQRFGLEEVELFLTYIVEVVVNLFQTLDDIHTGLLQALDPAEEDSHKLLVIDEVCQNVGSDDLDGLLRLLEGEPAEDSLGRLLAVVDARHVVGEVDEGGRVVAQTQLLTGILLVVHEDNVQVLLENLPNVLFQVQDQGHLVFVLIVHEYHTERVKLVCQTVLGKKYF